jgi:hypothetical protein
MTAPVEDVTELPGKTVLDQYDEPLGEIEEIYAIGGDGHPTWVTVDVRPQTEGGKPRTVFIPLARLKLEDGELQVPYSAEHLAAGPEIQPADELSEEDEGALRAYYSVEDPGSSKIRKITAADVMDEDKIREQRARR